jgi:BTB/POZ domain-containing protein 13
VQFIEIIKQLLKLSLLWPCRKKVKTTSSYIFDTLFINGESSDVTVVALGREWRLHRVYLCQANYFSAMFSGAWKESSEPVVRIEVPDERITRESLHLAFGSLYQDEVTINPQVVVSMLATAMLLGMVSGGRPGQGIQDCSDFEMVGR